MLHWTSRLVPAAAAASRTAPVLLLLEHAMRVLRPELGIAMVDSALHGRHLRADGVAALAGALPSHLAAVVAMADGRCESGIESVACYLLRLAGLRVEPQVVIEGVGRVDLLVEGRLIIELDGRLWHDDRTAFARDRRRDASAAAARYRTLRFDYVQVLFDWPSVLAAVLAALG